MRLFWAFRPPDDAVAAASEILAGLQGPCQRLGYAVTWARPASLHTTLKFLGDVEDARAPELISRMQRGLAMGQSAPAIVRLRGLGAFPSPTAPRSSGWVCRASASRIRPPAVAGDRGRRLHGRAGLPREERAYRAHLTLGRVRERKQPRPTSPDRDRPRLSPEEWRRGLTDLLSSYGDRPIGPPFAVKDVILYESRLGEGAPDYVPLATIPVGSSK